MTFRGARDDREQADRELFNPPTEHRFELTATEITEGLAGLQRLRADHASAVKLRPTWSRRAREQQRTGTGEEP